MKQRLARFVDAYGGAKDLLRDAHVYAGGLLVSIGAGFVYAPAAPITFGLLLLFIGLRRI